MHQRGAYRRVDAARERAEDASVAHLFANRGGRLLDEGGRFPGANAGGHLIEKVPDNLATLWGMNDLWVEGEAEAPGIIGEGRDQRIVRVRKPAKARRRLEDGVAVAQPTLDARRVGRE